MSNQIKCSACQNEPAPWHNDVTGEDLCDGCLFAQARQRLQDAKLAITIRAIRANEPDETDREWEADKDYERWKEGA